MHATQMSEEVAAFFEDANKLQWRKNADYHPDKVAFLEILQTAWECQMTVEQDLWAKIRKQYIALRSFVIEGQVESESPESRMIDIAVYMGMFHFWLKYKVRIIEDAALFVESHRRCESDEPTRCNMLQTTPKICDRCSFLFWLQRYSRSIRVS